MIDARDTAVPITAPEAGQPVFAPAIPFPEAATGRLHGRFGTLRLQTPGPVDVTLLLFEWEVELQQEFADATAHGDYWFNPLPITQRWTGRIRGYFTNSATTSYLGSGFNLTGVGALFTLNGYSDTTPSGGAPGTAVVFTGTAFAARGRLLVPMAMVTQELELTGVGPPTHI